MLLGFEGGLNRREPHVGGGRFGVAHSRLPTMATRCVLRAQRRPLELVSAGAEPGRVASVAALGSSPHRCRRSCGRGQSPSPNRLPRRRPGRWPVPRRWPGRMRRWTLPFRWSSRRDGPCRGRIPRPDVRAGARRCRSRPPSLGRRARARATATSRAAACASPKYASRPPRSATVRPFGPEVDARHRHAPAPGSGARDTASASRSAPPRTSPSDRRQGGGRGGGGGGGGFAGVQERQRARQEARAEHDPVGRHGGTGASDHERRDRARSTTSMRSPCGKLARARTERTIGYSRDRGAQRGGIDASVLMPSRRPRSARFRSRRRPRRAPSTSPLTRTCSTAGQRGVARQPPSAASSGIATRTAISAIRSRRRSPGERDARAGQVARPRSGGAVRPNAGGAPVYGGKATWRRRGDWNGPFTRCSTSRTQPLPRETARLPASAPRARARSRSAPARGGGPRPLPRSRRRCVASPVFSTKFACFRRDACAADSQAVAAGLGQELSGRAALGAGSSGLTNVEPNVLIPCGCASWRRARMSASVALTVSTSDSAQRKRRARDDLARRAGSSGGSRTRAGPASRRSVPSAVTTSTQSSARASSPP